MDRFIMHVYIDYPDEASEAEILRLVRSEEGNKKRLRQKTRLILKQSPSSPYLTPAKKLRISIYRKLSSSISSH